MKEVDVKKQTQRNMTLKWCLFMLLQYEIIVITSPSIAGVTYMDHFDFEQRYRDLNECNPFHWHPLHLPDFCADVFEKLIRSRLASKTPIRVVTNKDKPTKEKDTIYSLNPQQSRVSYLGDTFNYPLPFPMYQMDGGEYDSYSLSYPKNAHRHIPKSPMTPYEKIVEILKEDVMKEPSSPTVTVMPNFGPVAVYNQAISKKNMNIIRRLAEAFVKETKKKYDEYYASFPKVPSDHQLYVYDSKKNKTETDSNNSSKEGEEKEDKEKKEEKKNKNKVYRMKTKHGDVVTIVETKNLEMMKEDGFPLLNIEAIKKQQQLQEKQKAPKDDVEILERK